MRIAGLIRDRAEGRVILQMAWCLAVADAVSQMNAPRDGPSGRHWIPAAAAAIAAVPELVPPHGAEDAP